MKNVRVPPTAELKDGLLLGDNATNITLWRRGQENGWERIRSAMSPDGVELSEDIVGARVTVSKWKERARGFFGKLLQRKADTDVMTDEIPQAGGKSIEVEQSERGGQPAFLAWTKRGGIEFTEKLVAELFPGNVSYQILSVRNDLCLMLGEFGKEASKTSAASLGPGASSMSPAERYMKEVEEKFPHRLQLTDYPEGSHIPGFECLETEEVCKALAALREAEAKGISRTELFVPKQSRGVVSFILQSHPLRAGQPGYGTVDAVAVQIPKVQGEILRLLHALREQVVDTVILIEGTPYDRWFSNDACNAIKNMVLSGTNAQVGTPEGQKILCENPGLLLKTMQLCDRNGVAAFCLVPQSQFPGLRGAEHPNLEAMFVEFTLTAQLGDRIKNAYFRAGGDTSQIRVQPSVADRSIIFVNGRPCERAVLLKDLRTMLRAWQRGAELDEQREEYVVARMKESPALPHLIFGAMHHYSLFDRFACEGLAVLLTTPASLSYTPHFAHFADERNRDYAEMEQLIKALDR